MQSTEQASIPTTTVRLTENYETPSLRVGEPVQIALDQAEEELFAALVGTARAFERNELPHVISKSPVPVEVRVAGGWVRDKLLGLQTHDVDIAVDQLTGVEFATLVSKYCQDHHQQTGRMGVIAANPAQSKHLETATMKVCGIEVDFCNLRAQEIYLENSRIPMTSFGSPLEDAQRRDFTVNALFYNLKSKQVEDWTGTGVRDLVTGHLVTPLEPVQTFRDDPLRVLRAIRFAVRYNFTLDPSLEAACKNLEIHRALHVKVSRERVGKELEGMLSGKGANPIVALFTISRLKLAGSVFLIPQVGVDNVSDICGTVLGHDYVGHHDSDQARRIRELGWEEANALLGLLGPVMAAHRQVTIGPTHMDQRLLPVAVFLLPFRTLVFRVGSRSGAAVVATQYTIREGIKFKNKDVQSITTLHEAVDDMAAFAARSVNTDGSIKAKRLDAGLLLRKTKELWVSSLLMATVLNLRHQQLGTDERKIDWISISQQIYGSIVEQGLDECWKMKPLLTGKDVIEALNLPRGPEVGTYLDEQVKWMLLNPEGSREDCESHLMSIKRHRETGQNESLLGISDNTAITSSPLHGEDDESRHFSKRMHVESMDLS